jgi:hypothetical protein
MNDLRVLTNAELDVVRGRTFSISNGCNTGTATYATMRRTTSCCCGGNLVLEVLADIFSRFWNPKNHNASSKTNLTEATLPVSFHS